MKEDSQENKIWREGGGNIKAQVWWRKSVDATCGGGKEAKNLCLWRKKKRMREETIIDKHYFN